MKYIVFTSDNGEVIVCTPETEAITLEGYFLNSDKTAPEGFERQVIEGPCVTISPMIKVSCVGPAVDD